MAIVATASTTVRNKNLIFTLMCIAFTVWFGYDGLRRYPAANDRVVAIMAANARAGVGADKEQLAKLEGWPGWAQATSAERADVDAIVKATNAEGWHSAFDIRLQIYLTIGLAVVSLAAIARFLHGQRRRAIADENGLSPEPGLIIPWSDITKIDNTRWNKMGIVDLEYSGADGKIHRTLLDSYSLDDLPPLLNELATRADKAQFIPPVGDPAPSEDAETPAES